MYGVQYGIQICRSLEISGQLELPRWIYGYQNYRREHGNDADDYQDFYQGEAFACVVCMHDTHGLRDLLIDNADSIKHHGKVSAKKL